MTVIWLNKRLATLEELGPDDYDLTYVAATLAKLNRFAGHTSRPYSVAQHAVLTSYLAQPGYEFECLHHDDEEAFGGDIISPLKSDANRALFQKVRSRCVAPALDLAWHEPKAVKLADMQALHVEQYVLQRRPDEDVPEGMYLARSFWIRLLVCPMPWRLAKWVYLARHWWLTAQGRA